MYEKTIAEFLAMKQFAIFGASEQREFDGYKIIKKLAKKGYKPYPVNPRMASIGKMRCFGNLGELPIVPQVIVIALPPEAALEVLKAGVSHGVRRFWIQPGSESDDVQTYISEHGLSAVLSERGLGRYYSRNSTMAGPHRSFTTKVGARGCPRADRCSAPNQGRCTGCKIKP